ncbi:Flavocytochrome c [Metschnikowia bicuspidata var. bicuspidata NRRL YB-4993]|uniref:Fumarate reductase n=1 Tax=Metschnikowia bicuspidata var. bicuspidata NRRL YB-4993 TaxID=869754 RepID=A0A1A0HDC0_9ASCO|nr:Flavocytochrome c [Metschnikowia bicuspidata var. bicuspidata NRRL YB-4993]OBA21970.1 Flavocytochrome c [Metschnikowia bicuspidata var. bicuspidata NRRL YB-4993]
MTPIAPQFHTVVVGSGLAGLTATLKLLEKGFSVALVEKTASLGGNSIKASSGINGVPTKYQDASEGDSVANFVTDTTVSGKGLCDKKLVDILAGDSASAIEWLTQEMNVNLSVVNRLGGHSFARTHRGSGKLPPGFAIISALAKKVKDAPNVEIMTLARLQGFLKNDRHVTGVVVEKTDENGEAFQEKISAENVVLATGGFLADTASQDSLVRQYRPDLVDFPLTNGQQTTGDGHRVAISDLDAKLVQMDQIQVHPTGFIQLKDESTRASKWKFLCGELVRGIGGILLSPTNGERFVNELSTRDHVTAAIMEHGGDSKVAIIIVGSEDYKKAASHIGFYVSQLLMFEGNAKNVCEKLRDVDPGSSCSELEIQSALTNYNRNVESQTDLYGRSHFGNPIKDEFYFGFVTPVLHFTMGGVETNEYRQVIQQSGDIVPNVYAIGELSAGVHGANRLAGSSLLECVVFGTRVADYISGK